ncbi:uncharacterized protein J4E84_001677 [Alternaria hordeiaustralica]|uniref:uncharacterized protein n=1 Tax=Alternaria hordeiaustralica TaxID=1187925 RepID=UPI0020C54A53|nr:uncharacterized protein J4E84_001677 [Alternaria hordeiaustralica]KAI4695053.1 hypothetical protein J4E84_001677 [Alternaria hordeiaustralica]
MAHDYRSPLDNADEELVKYKNPYLKGMGDQSICTIWPTDAPTDYISSATVFLEAEYANPDSPIHQDPPLPIPPDPDDNSLRPLKTDDDVFDAARIWLKCPLDHAIVMKYPTQLVQLNGWVGYSRVTLYYEKFMGTHQPRLLMTIKWLCPNTLDGIAEGDTIDRQWVDEPKAYKCSYVALCDYDNLVLLRFGNVLGIEGIRVTAVPRDSMRLAFLGFLLEACDAVLGEPGSGLS